MVNQLRNKWRIRILLVCLAFLFLSLTSTIVRAQEWGGTVPVTYIKEVSDAYSFSVRVSGAGSLEIENDTLRNEEKNYLLAVDEAKTIQFQSDRNSSIKKVTLNDKDVTQEIKDNRFIVAGKEAQQTLAVEFQNKTSLPVTGDSTTKTLFIVLLLLSFGVIAYLYVRRKKSTSCEVTQDREEQINEAE